MVSRIRLHTEWHLPMNHWHTHALVALFLRGQDSVMVMVLPAHSKREISFELPNAPSLMGNLLSAHF
jgi:hypothetical protein